MERRLAHAGQPGIVHGESAWIASRRWLEGESEEAAKAAVQRDIDAGKIVVIKDQE